MSDARQLNRLGHVSSEARPDEMLPAATHARQHATVRQVHETELIEDYVELIADLIDATGEARAAEVARRMDVRQATVAKMINRLAERGLVETAPYRPLHLSESGRRMAEHSRERHAVVLRFLRSLGVSEDTARIDAEGIEHHVSEETLELMRRHGGSER